MFGIVIFYPAGQPIRNRSGAEKCRMHGVPCFAVFPAKKPIRVKISFFIDLIDAKPFISPHKCL